MKIFSAVYFLTVCTRIQADTCGSGNTGDGICAGNNCCSQYGWCGTSTAHCLRPRMPAPSPTPPTSGSGTCGGGSRGDGVCANGLCCSQWGYCGKTSAHCSGSSPSPPTPIPPTPPTPNPTPPPISPNPPPTPPSGGSGTCGGGSRGDGVCADGLCCSQWGYCGNTSAHCSGSSPSPPTPNPPSPPSGGGATAYVTYHNYYAGQPLTQVSCSDGQTGLITRWGYSTIDPMAPYVAATSVSGWNSPNCGNCYEVVGAVSTVYLTAIDQCAPAPNGGMHFDIHPTAFRELMGDAGVTAGVGYVTFREVASSSCRGNRG